MTILALGGVAFATFLTNAQVAVNAGPVVPLFWIAGPTITVLIGLLVWAVRTIQTTQITMAVVQSQMVEVTALRKWKHDEVEQWRLVMNLEIGALKGSQEDHEKQLDNLHRRIERFEQERA
jgi:hypothetical protein